MLLDREASRGPHRICRSSRTPFCFGIGIDDGARCEAWRPDDGLRTAFLELRYVVASYVLILHCEDARLGPTASGSEFHLAHDGLEHVIFGELRELHIVERARAGDGLLDDLHLCERLWDDI